MYGGVDGLIYGWIDKSIIGCVGKLSDIIKVDTVARPEGCLGCLVLYLVYKTSATG